METFEGTVFGAHVAVGPIAGVQRDALTLILSSGELLDDWATRQVTCRCGLIRAANVPLQDGSRAPVWTRDLVLSDGFATRISHIALLLTWGYKPNA
ncbi:MAG: hypothetical protein CMK33_01420 [Porticoccaceae bacterium]|nr:hypothetical protein [Porticoccaceae bacterium]|tara:strand:- start:4489 stop:4779 length:291 start_codon:yes stop_codon:yes gene_type:complete